MNLDDLEKTRIGLAELLHVVGACSITLYNMNHDEEAELALKALWSRWRTKEEVTRRRNEDVYGGGTARWPLGYHQISLDLFAKAKVLILLIVFIFLSKNESFTR
ncbi:hypothetical protein HanRHA438_Chr09g0405371 [Helianthus annuus]|nr:hypothetical protein HanRHA438_Chr09g0405371 [Helianthus annuus]